MKNLILFFVFLMLAAVGYYSFGPDFKFGSDIRVSTKPIHPDEPGFNKRILRFTDYSNYKDLFTVLPRVIPPGTSRREVEALLSQQAAYIGVQPNGPDRSSAEYRYHRLYWPTSLICGRDKGDIDRFIVTYDSADTLQTLLFSEGPTCNHYTIGSSVPAGVKPFRP